MKIGGQTYSPGSPLALHADAFYNGLLLLVRLALTLRGKRPVIVAQLPVKHVVNICMSHLDNMILTRHYNSPAMLQRLLTAVI